MKVVLSTISLACFAALAQSVTAAEASEQAAPSDQPAQRTSDNLEVVRVTAAYLREPATDGTGSYTSNVVTIGKFPLELKEIPNSVSVLTRSLLDDQSITTLQGALAEATGITSIDYGDGTAYFQSRGYPANIQFEGLPTSSGLQYLPQFDLAVYDRIEVLRGAAGLLQGSGDPGGSINLVHKRPTDAFRITGSVSGGLTSGARPDFLGDVDVAGPLNSAGSIRGRAVMAGEDGDQFYDNGRKRHITGYGIVEFDLGVNTLLTLSGTGERDILNGFDYGQPIYQNLAFLQAPRSISYTPSWTIEGETSTEGYAELSHHFDNGWIAKANTLYREVQGHADYGFPFGPIPLDGTAFVSMRNQHLDTRWAGLDTNLSGPFDFFGRKSLLVIGYNYAWYSNFSFTRIAGASTNIFDIAALPKPDVFNPAFGSAAQTTESGLYGLTRLKLLDPLTLVLGGRVAYVSSYSRGEVPTEGPWSKGPSVNHKFVPYGGLIYDLGPNVSLYGSFADVFAPQDNLDVAGNLLPSRVGKQYEAGIKGQTPDRKLNASLALFVINDNNRAVGDPLNPNFYVARGEVRSKGVESEISGSPLPGWDIYGGYTYLETTYVQDPQNQGLPFDTEEPKHTLKLFTKYKLASGLPGLEIGGGTRTISRTAQGTVYQGGYTVMNALISYPLHAGWKVSLNADNLLDRKYFIRVPSSPGFSCCGVYGPPLTVMLTARKSY